MAQANLPCTVTTLRTAASPFLCYSSIERQALLVWLYAQIYFENGGDDYTSAAAIKAAAKSFLNESPEMLECMQVALAVQAALQAGVPQITADQVRVILHDLLCDNLKVIDAFKVFITCLNSQPVVV